MRTLVVAACVLVVVAAARAGGRQAAAGEPRFEVASVKPGMSPGDLGRAAANGASISFPFFGVRTQPGGRLQALASLEGLILTAYGIKSVVLRYFNASGADPEGVLGEDHHPEQHLIPRAIDAALGRDTFAIFGLDYPTPDGTCLRDYVHVTDLASAHILALESLRAGGPSASYNLGNGKALSVRDVLESIERVTGLKVPAGDGPRRPGDPAVLYASSDRIKRELGWKPHYEDIDVIVETAFRWREKHAKGYEDRESRAAVR